MSYVSIQFNEIWSVICTCYFVFLISFLFAPIFLQTKYQFDDVSVENVKLIKSSTMNFTCRLSIDLNISDENINEWFFGRIQYFQFAMKWLDSS